MSKKTVDPKTGAIIIQMNQEEKEVYKLKKRVKTLEQKVERLESLLQQLLKED